MHCMVCLQEYPHYTLKSVVYNTTISSFSGARACSTPAGPGPSSDVMLIPPWRYFPGLRSITASSILHGTLAIYRSSCHTYDGTKARTPAFSPIWRHVTVLITYAAHREDPLLWLCIVAVLNLRIPCVRIIDFSLRKGMTNWLTFAHYYDLH